MSHKDDLHKHGKSNLDKRGDNLGGRKSESEEKLWKRRFEEIRLVAMRMPISEIARQYQISRETVYTDIKKYQEFKQLYEKSGIDTEILTYEEVIRVAMNDVSKTYNANGKAALLGKTIEATKEISILRGSRKVDGSINVNNQMFMNQGAVNPYGSLDDRGLKEEFKRRRSFVSSGSGKKSKGKL